MIIAEQSDAVRTEVIKNSCGGLPQKVGSFYNEILIINYLNEALYAVDFRNRPVLIPQHPQLVHGQHRKVEIRSRSLIGKRTYDSMTNLENTPSTHEIMRIDYDDLRAQPHFVEEINAVLCFGDQLSIVRHPHSKEAIDARIAEIRLEVAAQVSEAPIVLVANDPSGQIDELFIEINGAIAATRVTHFSEESDNVLLALRDKEYSLKEFTRHRTTFSELLSQDSHVWTLGGYRLSSNRAWFEQVLEIERGMKPVHIEVAAVEALIKKSREEDTEKIRVMTEEKRELARRLSVLDSTHSSLLNGDYQERAAELIRDKLSLEREKVGRAKTEAEMSFQGERLKLRKELISTLGIAAKTAAVVIPLSIGLYKAIKAARSA